MSQVNLLNSHIGVSSVLPSATDAHLPEIKELSTAKTGDVRLEDLYRGESISNSVDTSLIPKVGHEELLQPKHLNSALQRAFEKMSTVKDVDVRHFVRDDMQSLMDNRELLNAYLGLMGMA
ncbi:MAG: hypothetical protein ACI4NE_05820 [Succinivibrio sp.]